MARWDGYNSISNTYELLIIILLSFITATNDIDTNNIVSP